MTFYKKTFILNETIKSRIVTAMLFLVYSCLEKFICPTWGLSPCS